MTNEDFFKDLEFYDKENIPDDIFIQLGEVYHSKHLTYDNVRKVCMAAAGILMWCRAVYQFAAILRSMKPKIKELQQAEDQLSQVTIEDLR